MNTKGLIRSLFLLLMIAATVDTASSDDVIHRVRISCLSSSSCSSASMPRPFEVRNTGNSSEEITAIFINSCELVPWATTSGFGYRAREEIDFLPTDAGLDISGKAHRRPSAQIDVDDYLHFWNRPEWNCGVPKKIIVVTKSGEFNFDWR